MGVRKNSSVKAIKVMNITMFNDNPKTAKNYFIEI